MSEEFVTQVFRCPICGKMCQITTVVDMLAPHDFAYTDFGDCMCYDEFYDIIKCFNCENVVKFSSSTKNIENWIVNKLFKQF